MKKILTLLITASLTVGTACATITNTDFKQILKTGTPEQVRGALADRVSMSMKDSLCYALRYSTQPGIIKVLADNGINF